MQIPNYRLIVSKRSDSNSNLSMRRPSSPRDPYGGVGMYDATSNRGRGALAGSFAASDRLSGGTMARSMSSNPRLGGRALSANSMVFEQQLLEQQMAFERI